MGQTDATTIRVSRDTRELLGEVRPYDSMSFDELLREMAESTEINNEI
jgi:hypothetical protein